MNPSRIRPALALVWLIGIASSSSLLATSQPSLRPLRLEDYYDQVRIGRIELMPEETGVVYERRHVDRDADTWTSALHALDSTGGGSRLLVADARRPRYSADGSFLAFLRGSQVWLLPSGGGEPWQATDTPEAVAEFAWAPDSTRLVIVTRDPRAEAPGVLPPEEVVAGAAEPMAQTAAEPEELDPGEWEVAEGVQPIAEAETQADLGSDPDAEPAAEEAPAEEVWLQPGAEPAVADRPLPRVINRLQFKADGEGYVGTRRNHLYVVRLDRAGRQPAAARRVTSGPWDDSGPAWSPDGRWIAFTSNRTPEADTNDNRDIWVVSPAGGEPIRMTDAPGPETSAAWSPDSRHLAYLSTPEQPPVYAQAGVWLLSLAPDDPEAPSPIMFAGAPVELTAGLDRPVASPPRWRADGTGILMTIEDRGSVPLIQLSSGLDPMDGQRRGRRRAPTLPRGVPRVLISGPRVVADFALADDGGELVAAIGWGTQPFELFSLTARPQAVELPMQAPAAHVQPAFVPPDASLRRLTADNDGWLSRVLLTEPEPLRYTSADGTPIEGWLLRPAGVPVGGGLPLVVRIHGGPVSQYTWALAWEHQWLAARGFAVLYVNPRGSSGYGLAFAQALLADWGGPDGADIHAGVDHLIERGVADPDRVGLGGWSYGGILTNALVTTSDRFAAAVSGASEADYFACYGTDDLQRWWEAELGLPYEPEARQRYRELSPIGRVDRIVTPTLFLAGEQDWRVPAAQSEQFYTQLRRRQVDGGPPTGLIIYPGQSHGGFPPSLSIDVLRRYEAWYDRHLRGNLAADPFFGLQAW